MRNLLRAYMSGLFLTIFTSIRFGRRVYRETNVISENKNANAKIIIKDTDAIRNQILDKLSMVGEL